MAKNKNTEVVSKPVHSQFMSDAIALLNFIARPVPKDATPFEIAQHAAAHVRISATPDAEQTRQIVGNLADELIERYRTETKTLAP